MENGGLKGTETPSPKSMILGPSPPIFKKILAEPGPPLYANKIGLSLFSVFWQM